MRPLSYAIRRVQSILAEIERLEQSDFPYPHSLAAARLIKQVFERRLEALKGLAPDFNEQTIRTACSESLLQVFRYLPLIGFILRSTNVRNSFEIFGPLLRLSRKVLGVDTKLILSSEWDFSPHVYTPISGLPDFVLLGLPASESGNPLLLPLAGHELGHPVWRSHGIGTRIERSIAAAIETRVMERNETYKSTFGAEPTDLFTQQTLAPAYTWAMKQAEESFCDFLGLRVFAESYLEAFAYCATAGGGHRSPTYPRIRERVSQLLEAAVAYAMVTPASYQEWFSDETPLSFTDRDQFLLRLADDARRTVVTQLIAEADAIAISVSVPERSQDDITDVLNAFALLTPASSVGDLATILNAAWQAYHDNILWDDTVDDRVETLNELVLKSIEILEIEARIAGTP